MSKLFCVKGKDYFEIVFEYNDKHICVQYEGRAKALRGEDDYKILRSEYATYGDKATLELLDYYMKRNNNEGE